MNKYLVGLIIFFLVFVVFINQTCYDKYMENFDSQIGAVIRHGYSKKHISRNTEIIYSVYEPLQNSKIEILPDHYVHIIGYEIKSENEKIITTPIDKKYMETKNISQGDGFPAIFVGKFIVKRIRDVGIPLYAPGHVIINVLPYGHSKNIIIGRNITVYVPGGIVAYFDGYIVSPKNDTIRHVKTIVGPKYIAFNPSKREEFKGDIRVEKVSN